MMQFISKIIGTNIKLSKEQIFVCVGTALCSALFLLLSLIIYISFDSINLIFPFGAILELYRFVFWNGFFILLGGIVGYASSLLVLFGKCNRNKISLF
jgi:hypothetical protein